MLLSFVRRIPPNAALIPEIAACIPLFLPRWPHSSHLIPSSGITAQRRLLHRAGDDADVDRACSGAEVITPDHRVPSQDYGQQRTSSTVTQPALQRLTADVCPLIRPAVSLAGNSSCLPSRIILLRHAQSQDLDELQAARVPDHLISLTSNGEQQARDCGANLHTMVIVAIVYSQQTGAIILLYHM